MSGFLIIGAGPAGLAAAETIARAGAGPVTVIERTAHPGGIPRLCGHSPFGLREFHRLLDGATYANRLARAAEAAGARILLNHAVTAIRPDLAVEIASPEGTQTLWPQRILLATGAREASRAERLLPGDRSLGVLTTGALQDLWFARRCLPFRRPLIYGSELVAMSAILTCRQAGALPLCMVEPGPTLVTRAPFRWLPKMFGIPVYTATKLVDLVAKAGRLDHVIVQSAAVEARKITCDGLVLTGDFRPETGLARLCGLQIDPATWGPVVDQSGRNLRPEIYAAGNLLRGIETAGACWAEGRAVARAMLADLANPPGESLTISAGLGLRYVMPQRMTHSSATAFANLQIRVERGGTGTLTRRDQAGTALVTRRLTTGPERRIALPMPTGAAGGAGDGPGVCSGGCRGGAPAAGGGACRQGGAAGCGVMSHGGT